MEYELDKFSDCTEAVDTVREFLEETLELLETRLAQIQPPNTEFINGKLKTIRGQ